MVTDKGEVNLVYRKVGAGNLVHRKSAAGSKRERGAGMVRKDEGPAAAAATGLRNLPAVAAADLPLGAQGALDRRTRYQRGGGPQGAPGGRLRSAQQWRLGGCSRHKRRLDCCTVCTLPAPTRTRAVLQGLVVGGCICYDMNFPEVARDLTFKGAELMVRIQGYM